MVSKLVVFNNCEGLKCLSETHAVSNDATVVSIDLVDCTFDPVLLKFEESSPDVGLNDLCILEEKAACILSCQKPFKNVIESLEINELGRVVDVELFKITENLGLYVLDQLCVIPNLIKPSLQITTVAVTIHFQI